ncbi:MAG TPA: flippase [Terriglobales bacterium]|nr:flippase [Terriglobales bacterium]
MLKADTAAGGKPRRISIARNTIWNFAGQICPMLLAAVAIPLLIHHLGVDRFGILSLVWILVGYFSLFDFGVGRAITKLLAETIAIGKWERASGLIYAAILSMILVGTVFGGALFAVAPWLSHSILKIPPYLQDETMRSLPWLAITVPFVTVSCGFKGVLEAQQHFALVNSLRAAFGIFNYLGPLAVLLFSHSLVPIVIAQAAARMINCGLYFWACKRSMPHLWDHLRWNGTAFHALFRFGSWLTVSNILSPIMVYLDRFLIGSIASVSSVAYYSAPFDAVTKLWMVPSSLEGVLFPAFSEADALKDRQRVNSLYQRSIAVAVSVLFPIVLAIVLFAPEILRLWLGQNFAEHSSAVLQILAIGVFTNSLAHLPYSLLQASGRPDLTAKLHFAEVPFYVVLLYYGVRLGGIEGAALAWTVRLTVESMILFFILRRLLAPRFWMSAAAGFAALVAACIMPTLLVKSLFFVACVGIFARVTWRWTLDDSLRFRVRSWLKAVPVLNKASA